MELKKLHTGLYIRWFRSQIRSLKMRTDAKHCPAIVYFIWPISQLCESRTVS